MSFPFRKVVFISTIKYEGESSRKRSYRVVHTLSLCIYPLENCNILCRSQLGFDSFVSENVIHSWTSGNCRKYFHFISNSIESLPWNHNARKMAEYRKIKMNLKFSTEPLLKNRRHFIFILKDFLFSQYRSSDFR